MISFKSFFRHERGVTAAEYSLMLALITVAIVAALESLGHGVS